MKTKLILFATVSILTSCGVNCDDYPVGPYHRGTYEVKDNNEVHFVGLDANMNNVDIIIPSKYYSLKDGELECYCNYGTK